MKKLLFIALAAGTVFSLAFTLPVEENLTVVNEGVVVEVSKDSYVLQTGSCGNIPSESATTQRKDGEIHMWTVIYRAPEGCPLVPETGVARYNVGFAGLTGTLTVTPSGTMISKFVSDRGK